MKRRCEVEIVELHQFFEDWFMGRLEHTDGAFQRFSGVMAEGFTMVTPGGTVTGREALVSSLKASHGAFSGDDSISIRVANIQLRQASDAQSIFTYEEWQDTGQGDRGRISSVVFRQCEGAPNGVEWVHVHETWMA